MKDILKSKKLSSSSIEKIKEEINKSKYPSITSITKKIFILKDCLLSKDPDMANLASAILVYLCLSNELNTVAKHGLLEEKQGVFLLHPMTRNNFIKPSSGLENLFEFCCFKVKKTGEREKISLENLRDFFAGKIRLDLDPWKYEIRFEQEEAEFEESDSESDYENSYSDLSQCSMEVFDASTIHSSHHDEDMLRFSFHKLDFPSEVSGEGQSSDSEIDPDFTQNKNKLLSKLQNSEKIEKEIKRKSNSKEKNKGLNDYYSYLLFHLKFRKKGCFVPPVLSHFARNKVHKLKRTMSSGGEEKVKISAVFSKRSPQNCKVRKRKKFFQRTPVMRKKFVGRENRRTRSLPQTEKRPKFKLLKPKIASIKFKIGEIPRRRKTIFYQPKKFQQQRKGKYLRKLKPIKTLNIGYDLEKMINRARMENKMRKKREKKDFYLRSMGEISGREVVKKIVPDFYVRRSTEGTLRRGKRSLKAMSIHLKKKIKIDQRRSSGFQWAKLIKRSMIVYRNELT